MGAGRYEDPMAGVSMTGEFKSTKEAAEHCKECVAENKSGCGRGTTIQIRNNKKLIYSAVLIDDQWDES